MKFRIVMLAMLAVMLLQGCMANPTVSTLPSKLELESSENIDQFLSKVESENNIVDEVNNGNIVYLKYYDKNNTASGMQDSLMKLCEGRYEARLNKTQDINLHGYGGSVLSLNQATEAARQWILRKYPEIEVSGSDVITGQCIRHQGEAQIVELLYAYQNITNHASDNEGEGDKIIPVYLIVMKSEYFDSMIEEALANEAETYQQRKQRLAKEAVIAQEREQIAIALENKRKKMEPFINGRGKQVCKGFTTSYKLAKYEINRRATIVAFVEDNTDSRIQLRITGHRVENNRPQDIFISDDIEYKGSKVIPGNIIWDAPTGWYFCNK